VGRKGVTWNKMMMMMIMTTMRDGVGRRGVSQNKNTFLTGVKLRIFVHSV